MATSREPLGVGGETTWRVPSLSLPRGTELLSAPTPCLFIERAVKVRPNFAVTDDSAPHVAQICQDLDGIPLAIELAAARVRVLSVERIAAELADRFHLLTGGERGALPRLQTLRASVDWSHELLDAPERTLLRRCGVFHGGFTLDACEAVCADDELDRYAVLDVLTSLVDKSLVLVEERESSSRFALLETIRQYALDRLAEPARPAGCATVTPTRSSPSPRAPHRSSGRTPARATCWAPTRRTSMRRSTTPRRSSPRRRCGCARRWATGGC